MQSVVQRQLKIRELAKALREQSPAAPPAEPAADAAAAADAAPPVPTPIPSRSVSGPLPPPPGGGAAKASRSVSGPLPPAPPGGAPAMPAAIVPPPAPGGRGSGGLSPEDKAAELRGRPDTVMVGDGINDALALRTASVGVAVGGGAEAALAVADVYMRRPGLEPLRDLLLGARRTRTIVHRNLGFSLVYNVLFASLALAGLVTPLLAAILMPLSSLTVVLGSLLQRSFTATEGRRPSARAQSLREVTPVLCARVQ